MNKVEEDPLRMKKIIEWKRNGRTDSAGTTGLTPTVLCGALVIVLNRTPRL